MPGLGPLVVSTGVAASDRRTFLEIKQELARTYNPDDPTTLATAGDSINSAIRAFNRYNWPWEVLSHDISISANVDTYPLPQMWKAPCSLHLTDQSSGRKEKRLAYIQYETYLSEYSLEYDGEPTYYTLRNQFESGQVTLWPRPTATYTAEIDYYRHTPILRSDSAPLEVPLYAEEAYLQWAAWEFAKRVGGEFLGGRLSVAKADAMQARAELVAMVALRGDAVGVV